MAVWSLGGMLYAWQDKKKLKTRWPFQTLTQTTQFFNITPILTTSFNLPRHLLLLNSVVSLVPITQSHLKTATVLWQCTPQYSDPTMSVFVTAFEKLKVYLLYNYSFLSSCSAHFMLPWVAANSTWMPMEIKWQHATEESITGSLYTISEEKCCHKWRLSISSYKVWKISLW